jgi:hypothetical protein
VRYPFIQVRQDTRAKALDLATLLGISDQLVRGQLEDLVVWVLDRSPEDAPPSAVVTGEDAATLIEGAVRWRKRGQRGAWVAKAITARLLTHRDGGGVELAAELIEPYVAAWHEKQAAKARAEKARERSSAGAQSEASRTAADIAEAVRESPEALREAAANVRAPYVDVHRQTQTQTQTQEKRARSVAGQLVSKALDEAGAALKAAADDGTVNGQPLGDAIEAAFRSARKGSAFRWTPKEHDALRRLMGAYPSSEILRRWKVGLEARFRTASSLVDLERDWNVHAQAPPAGTRAATRGETDWTTPPELEANGEVKL